MIKIVLLTLFSALSGGVECREFAIDFENDTFIMDGEPFQYISGSMHYFRCPHQLWRDRLRKIRDAGLNTVSTYIEWSQHEKIPGEYDFSGDLNFTNFIQTAAEEGLYVIVRPGPYICAERDMGGLPAWLLRHPDIRLRSFDQRYIEPARNWLEILFPRLQSLLYGNGGPVIMVQVENEYGSYPACDGKYLIFLRDLFSKYVQKKAVLFTTDGAGTNFLKCGKIPGVYATVDFGSSTNVTSAFAAMRRFEPRGPLVNSEFYPGWLTHWGEELAHVDSAEVQAAFREILKRKANVNFYMFHGGTNFAFTAGANLASYFQSDITSYDYDAPLTEAGDLTQKYYDIQQVISEFFPNSTRKRSSHQDIATKGDYGTLRLVHLASLLSPTVRSLLGQHAVATYPPTFEAMGSYFGYALYETNVTVNAGTTVVLKTSDVRDRALILQNGELVGNLSRELKTKEATFTAENPATVSLLVENLGRVNYGGANNDTKGIGNVTINGQLVENWHITAFSLESVRKLLNCGLLCLGPGMFRFYAISFVIDSDTKEEYLRDTFLDVRSLKKGLVFINDHNLGRYWTARGPQQSLYVPGVLLNKPPTPNTIVIFDEEVLEDLIDVKFSTVPIWAPSKKMGNPSVIQL